MKRDSWDKRAAGGRTQNSGSKEGEKDSSVAIPCYGEWRKGVVKKQEVDWPSFYSDSL